MERFDLMWMLKHLLIINSYCPLNPVTTSEPGTWRIRDNAATEEAEEGSQTVADASYKTKSWTPQSLLRNIFSENQIRSILVKYKRMVNSMVSVDETDTDLLDSVRGSTLVMAGKNKTQPIFLVEGVDNTVDLSVDQSRNLSSPVSTASVSENHREVHQYLELWLSKTSVWKEEMKDVDYFQSRTTPASAIDTANEGNPRLEILQELDKHKSNSKCVIS